MPTRAPASQKWHRSEAFCRFWHLHPNWRRRATTPAVDCWRLFGSGVGNLAHGVVEGQAEHAHKKVDGVAGQIALWPTPQQVLIGKHYGADHEQLLDRAKQGQRLRILRGGKVSPLLVPVTDQINPPWAE